MPLHQGRTCSQRSSVSEDSATSNFIYLDPIEIDRPTVRCVVNGPIVIGSLNKAGKLSPLASATPHCRPWIGFLHSEECLEMAMDFNW